MKSAFDDASFHCDGVGDCGGNLQLQTVFMATPSMLSQLVLLLLPLTASVASSRLNLVNLKVKQCDSLAPYVITLNNITANFLGDTNNTLVGSGSFKVSRDLEAPIRLEVKIRVALEATGRTPITIPCVNNFLGSCNYKDICKFAEAISSAQPGACSFMKKFGLPCSCPLREGDYSIPEGRFPLGSTLPSIEGVYGIQFKVIQNDETVSCYQITFVLQ